jgi:hypothetical protein
MNFPTGWKNAIVKYKEVVFNLIFLCSEEGKAEML